MNPIIRKGTKQDLPALFSLVKELAEFHKSLASVSNSVEQMEKERNSFEFLVAENDSEIIGMAVYSPVYSTWVGKSLYLDDLYVRPEYRGQKVGTRLLQELFTIARNENYHRLRWVVLEWNTHAREFFETIGMKTENKLLTYDFDMAAIRKFLERVS